MIKDESFLQYTHDFAFKWYQQADTKAQVILGFTGVFLSILVGAMFSGYGSRGSQIAGDIQRFPLTVFLIVMVFHLGAVILAAAALWSRGVFRLKETGITFFGRIANYKSGQDFKAAVTKDKTQDDYVDELVKNIHILSRNTRLKHRLVDLAAICSGLALFTTVLLAIALLK